MELYVVSLTGHCAVEVVDGSYRGKPALKCSSSSCQEQARMKHQSNDRIRNLQWGTGCMLDHNPADSP